MLKIKDGEMYLVDFSKNMNVYGSFKFTFLALTESSLVKNLINELVSKQIIN